MSKTRKPLSERESRDLGSWLNAQLGEGPGPETLAAQRLRLARTPIGPERRSARLWAMGGGALAAAAMVGGVFLYGQWRTETKLAEAARKPGISAEPLSSVRERSGETADSRAARHHSERAPMWRVSRATRGSTGRDVSAALSPGQWLEAGDQEMALELHGVEPTHAGRLQLASGTEARVVAVEASALTVQLERGAAQAVVSERGTQLAVNAGPYAVRAASATATYDVDWSPSTKTLAVQVSSGDVEVVETSARLRRLVRAGGSLNLPGELKNAQSADVSAAARKARIDRPAAQPLDELDGALGETPSAAAPAVVQPDVSPSAAAPLEVDSGRWRKFAENGQYTAAVKEAEQIGFGALEQSASASDLLLLADVARLGGAPQKARGVLLSLRNRFAGHTNAATAAFTLGRMAQEQEHDDRRAMQWYRTYLKEEPQGRMAEGARARLLKAALRVGSPAEKEQAARDYLARHPTGSSAAVARGVLSK